MVIEYFGEKGSKEPTYKTEGSVAADLYSTEEFVLIPGDTQLCGTGIRFQFMENQYAKIYGRSGLALKGVIVANSPGIIDNDYTGEIKVILHNLSREPFNVEKGTRIAQIQFFDVSDIKTIQSKFKKVKKITKETDRGEGGFGSTGEK